MKTKVVHRTGGPVTLDKTTHIYQHNTATGKVTRAEVVETGKGHYKLIEFEGCIYLPAPSLEIAQATFNTIFVAAKEGKVKLSWREKIAKWWIVLNVNFKRFINGLRSR